MADGGGPGGPGGAMLPSNAPMSHGGVDRTTPRWSGSPQLFEPSIAGLPV